MLKFVSVLLTLGLNASKVEAWDGTARFWDNAAETGRALLKSAIKPSCTLALAFATGIRAAEGRCLASHCTHCESD